MTQTAIPGLPEESANQIISWLKTNSLVEEAILFGSRAKGNYREGSDIDLCLKGSFLGPEMIIGLLNEYEALYLPWKLDLIIYSQITEPLLKSHIDRVGICIFRRQ